MSEIDNTLCRRDLSVALWNTVASFVSTRMRPGGGLSRSSSGVGKGVRVELTRLVPGEGKREGEKAVTGPAGPGCKVEEWGHDGARPTLES